MLTSMGEYISTLNQFDYNSSLTLNSAHSILLKDLPHSLGKHSFSISSDDASICVACYVDDMHVVVLNILHFFKYHCQMYAKICQ